MTYFRIFKVTNPSHTKYLEEIYDHLEVIWKQLSHNFDKQVGGITDLSKKDIEMSAMRVHRSSNPPQSTIEYISREFYQYLVSTVDPLVLKRMRLKNKRHTFKKKTDKLYSR